VSPVLLRPSESLLSLASVAREVFVEQTLRFSRDRDSYSARVTEELRKLVSREGPKLLPRE
jgi:hypothetical protein